LSTRRYLTVNISTMLLPFACATPSSAMDVYNDFFSSQPAHLVLPDIVPEAID
jgi:hypothetical protein